MRTISLINQKGGCGKTTCSINLAACLAHMGQRTLLVDMDPQGHCAVGLAVPDQQIERSVYDILRAPGASATLKDITWQIATNFDLAPSMISLAALETELHGLAGRQDRLSDALSRVAADYDFCIIDCPPNVGLLTFNAMRASSDVLIPVETGYFSLHGLAKQLELLEQLRKQCRHDLRIRILATLYDIRTKLAREVLAELRDGFGELLMEATINFNTKLKEAASFGQPITEYDPASKGFKDFQKLARELMGPAPRMSIDVARAVEAIEAPREAATLETALVTAQTTIEETMEAVQEGIELGEALPPLGNVNPNAPFRRSQRAVGQELAAQAGVLARRADEVRAAAQRGMGIVSAPREATLGQKLEAFYGVRQVPEGLMFVAHFPSARDVAIAGDFNNWNPVRMAGAGDDTFRAVVSIKPGKYRYRLVVDGRWQADPHNRFAEPNPFGELDSVVEVV
ncbi:MAG TPA: AAA family ATPase [Phycisphaerae bacterium]|nr:AAA family ATPase [Phycisphaerae bacterium]